MSNIRVSKISVKENNNKNIDIPIKNILLLVGPNNSGKSTCLREIERKCLDMIQPNKIIQDVNFIFPNTLEETKELIKKFKTKADEGDNFSISYYDLNSSSTDPQTLLIESSRLTSDSMYANNILLRLYTVRLDGRTRFQLIGSKPSGYLNDRPVNLLHELFQDKNKMIKVSKMIKDAFGLYIVIDPSHMSSLSIKVSSEEPPNLNNKAEITEIAKFCSSKEEISNLGDGIQCYTGLICGLVSLHHQIVLIDEPEAFLHPMLARKLARDLSELAVERDATLIVATHSPDFIMGSLEKTPFVSIARFTYENKNMQVKVLENKEIENIMKTPLSRSVGMFRALFHTGTIITESDADRSFYDEINRRLIDSYRGKEDIVILNAQNLQSIYKVIGPLKKLGIPTAAIMDLDLISDKKSVINNILEACGVSNQINKDKIYQMIKDSYALFQDSNNLIQSSTSTQLTIQEYGILALDIASRKKVINTLYNLEEYGIFLVPVGVLEQWLKHLGIQGDKREWLGKMFDKMGQDENKPNYVKPKDDDVWFFMDRISKWLTGIRPVKKEVEQLYC